MLNIQFWAQYLAFIISVWTAVKSRSVFEFWLVSVLVKQIQRYSLTASWGSSFSPCRYQLETSSNSNKAKNSNILLDILLFCNSGQRVDCSCSALPVSLCLSICLSVCLSVCLCIWLSCLFVLSDGASSISQIKFLMYRFVKCHICHRGFGLNLLPHSPLFPPPHFPKTA